MTDYLFVCDNFLEDYRGGAELTTEALIDLNRESVTKLRCSDVNNETIRINKDKFWVFGNFTEISHNNLLEIIKSDIKYSVIEYDLKYCKFRSPEIHRIVNHQECDCADNLHGKMISIFFSHAKFLWFMSQKQKKIYQDKFNFLKKTNSFVLSSVFDEMTLDKLAKLKKNKKDDNWIILNSPSWIKNAKGCIEYAKENNLQYELVWGLEYEELLLKLSKSRGLIFLPLDSDTCPRIVIEAKLLGCELNINENVLHKDEEWFVAEDKKTFDYLSSNALFFWKRLNEYSF